VKILGARSELRVSGSRTQRIEMIASAQRGRVSQGQLIEAGIPRDAIRRRVSSGYLLRLHRGVYAVGHRSEIVLGAETAALLACRDGAVLSHHSAAALWGMSPAGTGDGLVHITVLGTGKAQIGGAKLHRTRLLDAQDVRIHERLPVTSPARTLLDIAELITPRELERALDEALITHVVRPAQILELLARATGRAGRPRLRALLARQTGTTRTRSEAEERFLALIRSAQLPEPEVNARVHGYEVDFLWRAERLVVEIDGFSFHSSRAAFERDRQRDARLQAASLRTMRITWFQMENECYAVIARLALTLARALRAG
jgi:very-short-patch-repair endonuclease